MPGAKRQIGLLGGSFDPVHCAHIAIARAARADFHLDEIWFIPCALSPQKSRPHASNAHRLHMLRLALRSEPATMPLPIEFDRPPPSYTVDTLRQLHARYPYASFTFIIGADSLLKLHTWKEPLQILRLARIVSYARPGFPFPPPHDLHLPTAAAQQLLADCRTGTPLHIQSAAIRSAIRSGKTLPPSILPTAVSRYIKEKKLYT